MRKIKVLTSSVQPKEVAAIKKLAVDAGCLPEEITEIEAVGAPDSDLDDEIILVLLNAENCASEGLEAELKKIPNGGRRAICIWPEDADPAATPPSGAGKYSYSIVPWHTEKLRAVAADDDIHCFENAAGNALPKPPMEHNLCVDEKAKAKAKQK
jgi:hypothetical protein